MVRVGQLDVGPGPLDEGCVADEDARSGRLGADRGPADLDVSRTSSAQPVTAMLLEAFAPLTGVSNDPIGFAVADADA
jgi:hypothetical protein